MSQLSQSSMLVCLKVSQWTATKKDKDATQLVAREMDAAVTAGNYNKALVNRDYLKPIRQIVNEARSYYYSNTLPWGDNEYRLLTTARYWDAQNKIAEFKREFEARVSDFLNNWETVILPNAQTTLGKMFNPDEYPSVSRMQELFAFNLDVQPLPTAEAFEADLGAGVVELIKDNLRRQEQKNTDAAMTEVYNRLYTTVKHLSDKLSDPKAVWHETTLTNVQDLTAILSDLNIAKDPRLEDLKRELAEKVCDNTAKELKKDEDKRSTTAQNAASILGKIQGLRVQ